MTPDRRGGGLSSDRKLTLTLGMLGGLSFTIVALAFQAGQWARGLESDVQSLRRDMEDLKDQRCQCRAYQVSPPAEINR